MLYPQLPGGLSETFVETFTVGDYIKAPVLVYNFKTLSCTPTYLNHPISQFLHNKLIKFDVRLKFVKLSLLISMCKENLCAKMEKLEAQICRCARQGLKVMPCPVHAPRQSFSTGFSCWRTGFRCIVYLYSIVYL